jgi:hypothetical protein
MNTYIQNYGFTKTLIKDNHKKSKSEIQWVGDYDGNMANIKVGINDNGNKELVSMQLDNNDIMNLLGVQPIEIPLEQRLSNDFLGKPYKPITLEGVLHKTSKKRKTRKHKRRHNKHRHHKKRQTYKL